MLLALWPSVINQKSIESGRYQNVRCVCPGVLWVAVDYGPLKLTIIPDTDDGILRSNQARVIVRVTV